MCTYFSSLQKALQLHSLDEILDSDFVNAQQIIHNMTHVNKNGVVCNIEKEGMSDSSCQVLSYYVCRGSFVTSAICVILRPQYFLRLKYKELIYSFLFLQEN